MYFRNNYLIAAFVLFLVEVIIALYVRDNIIRPYGGDFLVVIFLYCLIRGISKVSVGVAATGVLILAYIIETAQYLKVIDMTGLGKYQVARVVLGTSFEWGDMVAYTLGILVVLLFENRKQILLG